MELRIEQLAPRRIACVRHVGPYDEVGDAWKTLMKWGWSRMLFHASETFGLCFDDPRVTPPAQCRYDACMVVDGKARARGDVELREQPAATYAVALHEGPLATLRDTYGALCAEVASGDIDGRRWTFAGGPSMERYLRDPRKTKPEDMRTEVWLPVHAAAEACPAGAARSRSVVS